MRGNVVTVPRFWVETALIAARTVLKASSADMLTPLKKKQCMYDT